MSGRPTVNGPAHKWYNQADSRSGQRTPNHPHPFGVPAIMDQGYYTDLFRKLGYNLAAHYFEPAVLDRFRNDPNYKVADTRVSTKYDATTESSPIQQYVWGRKADGQPCIVVLLPHLPPFRPAINFTGRHMSFRPQASEAG